MLLGAFTRPAATAAIHVDVRILTDESATDVVLLFGQGQLLLFLGLTLLRVVHIFEGVVGRGGVRERFLELFAYELVQIVLNPGTDFYL